MLIRDGSGFMQATINKKVVGQEIFDKVEKLSQESAIIFEGDAKEDKRAPGGYELQVEKIEIVSEAEGDFPITKKKHGPEFLLDNRTFWIRSQKMHNIMIIKAKIVEAARDYFKKEKFLEVQVPSIVGTAVEGGSTLFELKYFDKKAYLTQSWQLYGEAMIFAFGKCYTLAPSFRAEPSRTRRHLTEYWHLEAEMPFCGFEGNLKIQEELIEHICHTVAKECEKELTVLGRNPKDLLKVKAPFPRITYDEAVKTLEKDGVKFKSGQRLGADEEAVLTKHFDIPFFVHHFPTHMMVFYHRPDPKDPKFTLSADLLAPEGYGEIIGGSERLTDKEELLRKIKAEKLDPDAYKWYIDLRRWGSVPHSGFGLGIERTVMWICKLKHIRDAIAFPRMMNRIYP